MSNEGIELKVLASSTIAAPSYVDTLTGRVDPKYLDEVGPGGGSFRISPTDPQVLETPTLLDYRNVIQHCVDGNVVGAWLVQTDTSETISDSEGASEVRDISGPGLLQWLDDATLKPTFGFTRFAPKKRFFNFASERGDWYNPTQWTNPRIVGNWGSIPWGAAPTDWPEDSRNQAKWIWNGPYTGSGMNIQSPPWVQNTFRMEFTTGDDGGTWVFYMSGDDFLQAWVDGAEVVTTDYQKSAWDKTTKVEMQLPAGNHVFAARVTNSPAGPGAFMFALYHDMGEGVLALRKWSGQNNTDFKGNYNPAVIPTWSPGEIMLKIIAEAKARGVRSMNWLKPTFTTKLDSNGVPWIATSQDWEFSVGDSYLKVLNQILELGYYAWVNPATFELNITSTRGTDRSIDPGGMTFERGKNLRKAASEGVGKVKNSLDVATAEGWLIDPSTKDTTSIGKYGVLEGTYSADVQAAVAKSLMAPLFRQYATPEEGATYDIVAIDEDEVPYINYMVGDWVLAPDKRDLLVKRRVVSISVEESPNGRPLYSLEFDTIFRSNEQKLNQMVSNITGGNVGGSMSNSGSAPSFSDPIKSGSGTPRVSEPRKPEDLVITSDGAWNPTGVTPISTAHLSWSPVTLNMNGAPITVDYYEVWARRVGDDNDQLMGTVTGTTADVQPFTPGDTWEFRLRALITEAGPKSAFTEWQSAVMKGPTTPMPAPNAPTVTSEQGLVIVNWDGTLGGTSPEPRFRYVYAEVSSDGEQVTWEPMGSAFQRDTRSMSIPGLPIGAAIDVRLIAVDGLGIRSAPSESTFVTVTGIDLGPLEESLNDAIDAVKDSVADVRESTNMLEDGSFDLGTEAFWDWNARVTNVDTAPRTGGRHLKLTTAASSYEAFRYIRTIECDPGDTFRLSIYVRTDAGMAPDGVLDFSILSGVDPNTTEKTVVGSSLTVGPNYVLMSGVWTAPLDTYFFRPMLTVKVLDNPVTFYIDDARLFRMVGQTMIVDGSIVAEKIAAEAVSTQHLQAGSVSTPILQTDSVVSDKILSNTILARHMTIDSVDANNIKAGAVQTNHLSPSVGEDLDISANNTVTIIAGQLGDVASATDETQNDLAEMQTYYQFGPAGATVSTPQSPFAVGIKNDRIEMLENGNVVSYWNSGTLYVDQMVGQKVILGNHQLEKYQTGTVVRAL